MMPKRLAMKDLSCNGVVTLIKFLCSFGVKVEEHPLPISGKGLAGAVRHWSIFNGLNHATISLITERNCA
jgi:hypothetical protein